jgi:hypothetical protein
MKEGYTKKSLDSIIGKENLRYLFDLIDHPGWQSLREINQAIKEDWIEQTSNLDLSIKTDEEMLRIVRARHGMIKGVDLFLTYLEKKRKEALPKDKKVL